MVAVAVAVVVVECLLKFYKLPVCHFTDGELKEEEEQQVEKKAKKISLGILSFQPLAHNKYCYVR